MTRRVLVVVFLIVLAALVTARILMAPSSPSPACARVDVVCDP